MCIFLPMLLDYQLIKIKILLNFNSRTKEFTLLCVVKKIERKFCLILTLIYYKYFFIIYL